LKIKNRKKYNIFFYEAIMKLHIICGRGYIIKKIHDSIRKTWKNLEKLGKTWKNPEKSRKIWKMFQKNRTK
jgi:hypothetical protein